MGSGLLAGQSEDMEENDFSGVKRLYRTRDGRIVAGVASGIGRYVGIDANVVRVIIAGTTFFGGLGAGIYLVGWLLMPSETTGTSVLERLIDKHKDDPVWQDAKVKAREGWAKAEHWARTTGQNRPQGHPGQGHPGYADPTPYYSGPAAPQDAYATPAGDAHSAPTAPPRRDDEPRA